MKYPAYFRSTLVLIVVITFGNWLHVDAQTPIHEIEIFGQDQDMFISSDSCDCTDNNGKTFRASNLFVRSKNRTSYRIALERKVYGVDGERLSDSIPPVYSAKITSFDISGYPNDSCATDSICYHNLEVDFDAFKSSEWDINGSMEFFPAKHDIGVLHGLELKCPCTDDRVGIRSRKFNFNAIITEYWLGQPTGYSISCRCTDCQKCPTER